MTVLYLHIGSHKTGTTSLQRSLNSVKKELSKNHWGFVNDIYKGNSSYYITPHIENGQVKYKLSDDFYRALKREAKNNHNVILSGEHFFALNDIDMIATMFNKLSDLFSDIRVVVYLRRQDKLALSFKQQASKGIKKNFQLSSMLCGHSSSALPELNESLIEYLDYYNKMSLWISIFGEDNVVLKNFDNMEGGDVCIDFGKIIKLPILLPKVEMNEGVTRDFSLLSHKLLSLDCDSNYLKEIRNHLPKKGKKILLPRNEAIDFYAGFKRGNEGLSSLGIEFDDNFQKYPDSGNYYYDQDFLNVIFEAMSKVTIKNKKRLPFFS